MTSQMPTGGSSGAFPLTRWSVVLAAKRDSSPESAAALETLCRAYWYPLYAYVRRSGHSAHDAQDLTQEFFYRLLQKRWLDSASPERGKLRTFLIVALKKFLAKEWRRESAQRRGSGQTPVPFDTAFAESRLAGEPSSFAAEETFDQQWALTLLELTMSRLREEFHAAGKVRDFDALKHSLLADRGGIDYGALAQRLGVNQGAARVAAHRLRKRFRELYREEIAQTLSDGADLDEEVRHLAAALARK